MPIIFGRQLTILLLQMKIMVMMFCLIASFTFLASAGQTHQKIKRLAVATPVMASITRLWVERVKNQEFLFAEIVFDRKSDDGHIEHCDVKKISMIRGYAPGDQILIAPKSTTCAEPDFLCDTCNLETEDDAITDLKISAILGLLFGYLFCSSIYKVFKSNRVSGGTPPQNSASGKLAVVPTIDTQDR